MRIRPRTVCSAFSSVRYPWTKPQEPQGIEPELGQAFVLAVQTFLDVGELAEYLGEIAPVDLVDDQEMRDIWLRSCLFRHGQQRSASEPKAGLFVDESGADALDKVLVGGGGGGGFLLSSRSSRSNVGVYSTACRKASAVVSPALENAMMGVFPGRSVVDDVFTVVLVKVRAHLKELPADGGGPVVAVQVDEMVDFVGQATRKRLPDSTEFVPVVRPFDLDRTREGRDAEGDRPVVEGQELLGVDEKQRLCQFR